MLAERHGQACQMVEASQRVERDLEIVAVDVLQQIGLRAVP
jgi:hypothetical protein